MFVTGALSWFYKRILIKIYGMINLKIFRSCLLRKEGLIWIMSHLIYIKSKLVTKTAPVQEVCEFSRLGVTDVFNKRGLKMKFIKFTTDACDINLAIGTMSYYPRSKEGLR